MNVFSLTTAAACIAAGACAAGEMLVDFDRYDCSRIIPVDFTAPYWVTPQPVETGKIKVEKRKVGENTVIDVTVADPFLDNPGIALLPPKERKYWDISAYEELHADIENLDRNQQLMLSVRVNNPRVNNRQTANNSGFALNPGERGILKLYYPQADEFPPVKVDWMLATPPGVPGPKNVDGRRVEAITLWGHSVKIYSRNRAWRYRIHSVRLVKPKRPYPAAVGSPETFFPFVDRYGQYRHDDWPDKIHEDADFKKALDKETAGRKGRIAGWNRFGGWANGPKLEAKGYFYPAKYEGKWYLVDPEGCLFVSHGVCTIRYDIRAERKAQNWFPPELAASGPNHNFSRDNLRRKFGPELEKVYPGFVTRRLEEWGLNTIGNWADLEFMRGGGTPYAMELPYPECPRTAGVKGLEGGIFDVFSTEFAASMRSAAARPEFAFARKDPMLIGIFITNEIYWGNDRTAAARSAFASPATQPAKREFIKELKRKYISIDVLNDKWGSNYADWQEILDTVALPDAERSFEDFLSFNKRIFEVFYSTCRDVVKEFSPNAIYFGSRIHLTNMPELFEAASRYADVVSTNTYTWSFDGLRKEGLPEDKPILISEFHVGVLDRGMFNADLRPAGVTQQDRAQAYLRLLQGALLHPQIVGTHFFCYRDSPVTGRWDGENFAIGMVDVTDTPYWELTAMMRKIGANMIQYRLKGEFKCDWE